MNFRTVTQTGAPPPDSMNKRSKSKTKRILLRIVLPVGSVLCLAAALLIANFATRAATPKASSDEPSGFTAPLSTAQCVSDFEIRCYTPAQFRTAYDLAPLYNGTATGHPLTGAGETIVITEPYGSPALRSDLAIFDAQFKLPSPNLTIEQVGKIPTFDQNSASMSGWAEEATLNVEYSHVIAPGAKIVLVETATVTAEGATGLAQEMTAQEALINKGVGDVFVETATIPENTFAGFSSGNYSSLLNLRGAIQDAYSHHATVLAASGDIGVSGTKAMAPPYPSFNYRVAAWPATDPLVTAVGGTTLNLNQSGNRLSPDVVWNNEYGASGGGDSSVFTRPQYQNSVAGAVGDHRGMPDISMNAAPGAWGYFSLAGGDGRGWHIFAGTTGATPMMAGIVALADQLAGHRLGLINTALYKLAALKQAGNQQTGLVTVSSGSNTFDGVTGYQAATGYNLASGWGTIDAAKFVPALVHASSAG